MIFNNNSATAELTIARWKCARVENFLEENLTIATQNEDI